MARIIEAETRPPRPRGPRVECDRLGSQHVGLEPAEPDHAVPAGDDVALLVEQARLGGLTVEVVKDPIGSFALLSRGTFGHGGAFGTHGFVDKAKKLVGVFLVQRSGNDPKNAFFQLAGAAVTE